MSCLVGAAGQGCCDEVHVLRLPGWVQSAGVLAEILMAMGLGKKVVFVEVDNYLEEM